LGLSTPKSTRWYLILICKCKPAFARSFAVLRILAQLLPLSVTFASSICFSRAACVVERIVENLSGQRLNTMMCCGSFIIQPTQELMSTGTRTTKTADGKLHIQDVPRAHEMRNEMEASEW
jgi:hypothetical protein